jgi:hypothetical protein
MTSISSYAAKIMAEIDSDIADGTVPATVATFGELHDHVDANDYAQQVGVPFLEGDDDPWQVFNAVEDEVDRRPRERAAQI